MAEATDLKSVQCRFESDRGYIFFTQPHLDHSWSPATPLETALKPYLHRYYRGCWSTRTNKRETTNVTVPGLTADRDAG